MATWGNNIYEDDIALDVRELFLKLYSQGKDIAGIQSTIQGEFIQLDDDLGNDIARLALCCVEIESGTLSDEVKEAALAIINSDTHVSQWESVTSKEDALHRKSALESLAKNITEYTGDPLDIAPQCGLEHSGSASNSKIVAPSSAYLWRIFRQIGLLLGYISLALLASYVLYMLYS